MLMQINGELKSLLKLVLYTSLFHIETFESSIFSPFSLFVFESFILLRLLTQLFESLTKPVLQASKKEIGVPNASPRSTRCTFFSNIESLDLYLR